jgi:transposase
MIQITPHMRILVAVEAIDFRAGIDGLASLCRQRLEADPFSGSLFVFRNRARTALKILVYDGYPRRIHADLPEGHKRRS